TYIADGTLHLTGSLESSPQTWVNDGGTLSGTGTLGNWLIVESGGTVSPGSSPGTLFAGNTVVYGGGSLVWEINDAAGAAGANPGWDLLSLTGQFGIDADSSNPFTIYITSLIDSSLAGAAANFDPDSPYAFDFIYASGGFTTFSTDAFAIDTSGFANAFTGIWSIGITEETLQLLYTPTAVPEPATYAAIAGAVALGLATWRRRRLAIANSP